MLIIIFFLSLYSIFFFLVFVFTLCYLEFFFSFSFFTRYCSTRCQNYLFKLAILSHIITIRQLTVQTLILPRTRYYILDTVYIYSTQLLKILLLGNNISKIFIITLAPLARRLFSRRQFQFQVQAYLDFRHYIQFLYLRLYRL